MQLFLRGVGPTKCVDVDPTALIAELKLLVEDATHVPCYHQILVHNGRQLPDSCRVKGSSLQNHSTVHLVCRLRGGKGGFGALLRGQGRDGKLTTNYDACRDLNGRRLRHATADEKLAEWQAKAKQREQEKAKLYELKEAAKQERREAANQVDTESIVIAQRAVVESVSAAVRDALFVTAAAKLAKGSSGGSGGSGSDSGSTPRATKRSRDAAPGGGGGSGARVVRPRCLAALEGGLSDSDGSSSDTASEA